ncbi:MAG: hypothetical protein QOJ13_3399 [Gaiellales bacterium]|nr:hypothetical protein [Gaiellales bacterium]
MNRQLELFASSRRLADVPLLARLAGAERVLNAEPDLDVEQRMELLLLVVCPALGETEP